MLGVTRGLVKKLILQEVPTDTDINNAITATTISNLGFETDINSAITATTISNLGFEKVVYDSGYFNVSNSTAYVKTHNLNNSELTVKVLVKVKRARDGWAVNDIIDMGGVHGFVNDVYDKKGFAVRSRSNDVTLITAQNTCILEVQPDGDDGHHTYSLRHSDVQFRVLLLG